MPISEIPSLKKYAVDKANDQENKFDQTDGNGVEVDQTIYENLKKHLKVYGDIVQCETEESLYEELKKVNNDVTKLIKNLTAKHVKDHISPSPTGLQE